MRRIAANTGANLLQPSGSTAADHRSCVGCAGLPPIPAQICCNRPAAPPLPAPHQPRRQAAPGGTLGQPSMAPSAIATGAPPTPAAGRTWRHPRAAVDGAFGDRYRRPTRSHSGSQVLVVGSRISMSWVGRLATSVAVSLGQPGPGGRVPDIYVVGRTTSDLGCGLTRANRRHPRNPGYSWTPIHLGRRRPTTPIANRRHPRNPGYSWTPIHLGRRRPTTPIANRRHPRPPWTGGRRGVLDVDGDANIGSIMGIGFPPWTGGRRGVLDVDGDANIGSIMGIGFPPWTGGRRP